MKSVSIGKFFIFLGYILLFYVVVGTLFPSAMIFHMGRLSMVGLLTILAGKVFVLEDEVKTLKQKMKDERDLPDLQ